jgi:hypothetical protein
MAYLQC